MPAALVSRRRLGLVESTFGCVEQHTLSRETLAPCLDAGGVERLGVFLGSVARRGLPS
jgi:hypothetical protein